MNFVNVNYYILTANRYCHLNRFVVWYIVCTAQNHSTKVVRHKPADGHRSCSDVVDICRHVKYFDFFFAELLRMRQ